jgi:hypothetical protein
MIRHVAAVMGVACASHELAASGAEVDTGANDTAPVSALVYSSSVSPEEAGARLEGKPRFASGGIEEYPDPELP